MIELTFLKELMLIKQVYQKSVLFVTIGIIALSFNQMFVVGAMKSLMSINLSNIAILNIKGSDYHCIVGLIIKNEAIKLMEKADLTETSGAL